MTNLESIAPEAAMDLYLDQRRSELSDATLKAHRSRIGWFVEWCEDNEIHDMSEVTGRDLHTYRVDRREDGDLTAVSLKTQLSTLRVFLEFCASIDAVPDGLREKVMLPKVPDGEDVSRSTLDHERADAILDHLEKFYYASRKHVMFALLWRTGMRSGSLRALDLDDYAPDGLALELRHRPEMGTPLKNGERGERDVALSPSLAELLGDYIGDRRVEKTDDHGREPLLTTREGRVHQSTLRNAMYRVTRPCVYADHCPHDRDPEECEAAESDNAHGCPSARSPHDLRSGAITAHLLDDVPVEIVSGRMDVTQDVLDRHYDRRSEREKMEQRRQYLHGGQ